jgi:hypothetical protein
LLVLLSSVALMEPSLRTLFHISPPFPWKVWVDRYKMGNLSLPFGKRGSPPRRPEVLSSLFWYYQGWIVLPPPNVTSSPTYTFHTLLVQLWLRHSFVTANTISQLKFHSETKEQIINNLTSFHNPISVCRGQEPLSYIRRLGACVLQSGSLT